MLPEEYKQQAMKFVYPDLSYNERLGLSAIGMSGELGEVNDLLKKFLYHRNGKALDINKIKDELGDVFWYIALLCDTIDITFEDAMKANIEKLSKRHENGFTPRYDSDSKASI